MCSGEIGHRLRLDPDALSEEMQIFVAGEATQNDVTDDERRRIDWSDSGELPGFDSAAHGVTPRAEGNGFAALEANDEVCGPAHQRPPRARRLRTAT
jgi:hypothetical protein